MFRALLVYLCVCPRARMLLVYVCCELRRECLVVGVGKLSRRGEERRGESRFV